MTKKKMAKQLARLYQQHVISHNLSSVKRGGRLVMTEWLDLGKSDRQHFMRCASIVLQLEADPREYVIAQFKAFEEYSRRMGKFILPLPGQLASIGAQVRYATYKARQEELGDQALPASQLATKHYSESRRLSALAKRFRCTEEDIIASQPETFSERFLKDRGAWPAVADLWRDRNAS